MSTGHTDPLVISTGAEGSLDIRSYTRLLSLGALTRAIFVVGRLACMRTARNHLHYAAEYEHKHTAYCHFRVFAATVTQTTYAHVTARVG